MRQIRLQNKVKADLLAIQIYTQNTWGTTKAEEMLFEIDQTFASIRSFPFLGKTTRGKNVFVKTLVNLPFIIVYKVDDTSIVVIKITHTKRRR